jgi:hypothetical protein
MQAITPTHSCITHPSPLLHCLAVHNTRQALHQMRVTTHLGPTCWLVSVTLLNTHPPPPTHTPPTVSSPPHPTPTPQGVIRPGLLSLRERYRLRGRELAEDGLVLAEQLDAAREGNGERLEELAALRRQVRQGHTNSLRALIKPPAQPAGSAGMASCSSAGWHGILHTGQCRHGICLAC